MTANVGWLAHICVCGGICGKTALAVRLLWAPHRIPKAEICRNADNLVRLLLLSIGVVLTLRIPTICHFKYECSHAKPFKHTYICFATNAGLPLRCACIVWLGRRPEMRAWGVILSNLFDVLLTALYFHFARLLSGPKDGNQHVKDQNGLLALHFSNCPIFCVLDLYWI